MENQQQTLSEEQYRQARVIISAYKNIFSTPEGKLVLEDLEKTHHIYSSTFAGQDSDVTSFREGERNVVLRIKVLMAKDLAAMDERMKHAQKPTLVV